MKLTQVSKGNDVWTVHVNGKDEDFKLDTRGQVYSFIRAARMLKVPDSAISISRTLEAEYGFSGE